MSFHHAQPRKDDSSDNCDSLGELSKESHDISGSDSFSTENIGELGTSIVEAYDEETRFELLSAYVDDEVTFEERQLVAQWLRDEPAIQHTYRQLLMLRQAIRTAPTPVPGKFTQPPPTPPNLHQRTSVETIRWTLVCTIAIAILGGIAQLSTSQGRQSLEEAWQYIQTLPQETLFKFASATQELSTHDSHKGTFR